MEKITEVITVKAESLNYDDAIQKLQLQIKQKCAQMSAWKTSRLISVSCTNTIKGSSSGLPVYTFVAFIVFERDGNESLYS